MTSDASKTAFSNGNNASLYMWKDNVINNVPNATNNFPNIYFVQTSLDQIFPKLK